MLAVNTKKTNILVFRRLIEFPVVLNFVLTMVIRKLKKKITRCQVSAGLRELVTAPFPVHRLTYLNAFCLHVYCCFPF